MKEERVCVTANGHWVDLWDCRSERLTRSSMKQDVMNAVSHATFTNMAPTNTHAGLQYATDVSFTAANGAR